VPGWGAPVRHRVVKHGADIKNAFTLDLAHDSVVSAKIRNLIIETTRWVTGTEQGEVDPSADLSLSSRAGWVFRRAAHVKGMASIHRTISHKAS
jgi:hypothetical protein